MSSLSPHTSSTRSAVFGPVYASDHSFIHQGDTYIGQEPVRIEFEKFWQSLRSSDLSLREESIKTAYDGTFEWIFQGSAYQSNPHSTNTAITDQRYVSSEKSKAWLSHDSSDGRFWICGKAGSGKSTFVSFVSSHDSIDALLKSSDPQRNHVILRHYFWSLGTPLQKNLAGFLRSMVWQFFTAKPDIGFRIWYDHLKPRSMVTWSIMNLTNVLRTVLERSTCSFWIFIDGVDECVDSEDLIGLLHSLEALKNLKVCVSSRPERRYELAFKDWSSLQLDHLTYSDMRLYVEKRLRNVFLTNSQTNSPVLYFKDFTRNLVHKAEGVFVWLCVVVQSLKEGFENLDDDSTLLQRVDEYPEDIHQLYLFILKRHKGNLKRYEANGAVVFKLLLRSRSLAPDRSLCLLLALWTGRRIDESSSYQTGLGT